MAGEIVKTQGIVLAVHPWSQTSHVVTWLTPDHGPVTTLVKGAVRAKSAFLGQYDLFYRCDLLYYARASGDLHALREVTPRNLRTHLRGDWRATALAAYAADLVSELAPPGEESSDWFDFLDAFLEPAAGADPLARLIRLEGRLLDLAGLSPDFSGIDPAAPWTPFALDSGRCGPGTRTVRLAPRTVAAIRRPDAPDVSPEERKDAVRFLGVFLSYHIERPPDIRRALVSLISV